MRHIRPSSKTRKRFNDHGDPIVYFDLQLGAEKFINYENDLVLNFVNVQVE